MAASVNREGSVRSPAGQGQYRPARPAWLLPAVVAFVLIYWVFSLAASNIDLGQPVLWWEWLRSQLGPWIILPPVANPYWRMVLHALSAGVWLKWLLPAVIGYLLAERTAAAFLQTFYSLPSYKVASAFLSRLQSVAQSSGSRTSSASPSLKLLLYVLFVAVPATTFTLFAAVTEYLLETEPTLNEIFYYVLIVMLVGVAILSVLFALPFIPEVMSRLSHRQHWLARLAIVAIFTLFVLFMVGVMAALYGLLVTGIIDKWVVFIVALTASSVLLLFILLWIAFAPRPVPIILKEENLETLRAESVVFKVGGPAQVVIPEGSNCAITENNGQVIRVLKPGMTWLAPYEYVYDLLDVRQYDHQDTCKAISRDGIHVEVPVGISFRVASNDDLLSTDVSASDPPITRATDTELFPSGEQAIKRAAYNTKTVRDYEGKRVAPWHTLPLRLTMAQLRKVIANRNWDDLFTVVDGKPAPHPVLHEKTFAATQSVLQRARTGAFLLNLRLGPVLASENGVLVEQLNTWQARWKMLGRITEAAGQAEYLNTVDTARHAAEQLLLRKIREEIAAVQAQYGEELAQKLLALRLVETLDRVARRSGRYSPQAVDVLLKQLAEILKGKIEDNGDSGNGPQTAPPSSTQVTGP